MLKIFYDRCVNARISNKIYIGYSGGLDSSVLLNLCLNVFKKPNFSIRVINVNYLHNENSKNWNIFCNTQCLNYRIPITTLFVKTDLQNKNLEQEFRVLRYKVFFKLMNKSSTLLLAHNSSDLLETFFLNLFRGCGITGLLGTKEVLQYKNISIVRPIINFTKNEIFEYAMKNKINYITDFSNFDEKFNRNFLRFNLFKKIEEKWLHFGIPVLRQIELLNTLNISNNNKLIFFLKHYCLNNNFLNLKVIKLIPNEIRINILKLFIKNKNLKPLSFAHINELNKLITCKNNFQFIKIKNYIFYRDCKNLYLKKIKKTITDIKLLKYKKRYKLIKNDIFFNKKINNILFKNLIFNINKKKFLIIKCENYLIMLTGLWTSKMYSIFLKKKIIIKLLK